MLKLKTLAGVLWLRRVRGKRVERTHLRCRRRCGGGTEGRCSRRRIARANRLRRDLCGSEVCEGGACRAS